MRQDNKRFRGGRLGIFCRLAVLQIAIICSPISAFAGVDKLIKNVFPSGTMSNATKGGVVQHQSAGHLMGGSVMIRTPANPDLQMLHVQAPSCSMGGLPCGAQFEFFGGAASLMKLPAMLQHFQGLAKHLGIYAGITYIKTQCSFCEDVLEWMDNKADFLNQLANTNCQDMMSAADSLFNKEQEGARAVRQSKAVLEGHGSDAASFTQAAKADTPDSKGTNEELKSQLGENYNLVWLALEKKAPDTGEGRSLKELLMSISGTIIGTKDENGKKTKKYKKSLLNKDLIKQFIGVEAADNTTKIKLYVCDEPIKCLKPEATESNLNEQDVLFKRIKALLNSIAKKIQTNEGNLTSDEQTLIALSSLSLIPKLEMDLSIYKDSRNAAQAQQEFIEVLCFDVVTSYLGTLLADVQEAVGELAYAQIADGAAFKEFSTESRATMRMLGSAKEAAFRRYSLIAQTKGRMRSELKLMGQKFEEFISNQNGRYVDKN